MNKKERIINEINEAPELLLDEVLDFVQFLKSKTINRQINTALATEAVLKKDWLKPEEDEAWKGL